MELRFGDRIPPEELGRRLAATRRSRTISQEEVANILGVSRTTVVAMEKGTRPLKPGELIALAKLFGRTVHDLINKREYIGDFSPQFRLTQVAGISKEAVERAVDGFQKTCENYLRLETLLNAPMPRYVYPEPYSIEGLPPPSAAEEIATLERSRLNLGLGPISNLLEVMENDVGLRVFVLPLEEFRIAGMFAFTDRLGGCILVNGLHPRTRQHWSIGHEFAHFLTDRYREEVTVFIDYDRRPRAEQFADLFSACFLMPAAGLRQRFLRVVQSKNDFSVADLCLLADQYEVSVEAMTRRLESLGSLPRGTWKKLTNQGFDSHRAHGYLHLHSEQRHALRLPERYVQLAVQAFVQEKITESELARLLQCSRVEAREIVERLTEQSEIDPAGEPYRLHLNFGDIVTLESTEEGR